MSTSPAPAASVPASPSPAPAAAKNAPAKIQVRVFLAHGPAERLSSLPRGVQRRVVGALVEAAYEGVDLNKLDYFLEQLRRLGANLNQALYKAGCREVLTVHDGDAIREATAFVRQLRGEQKR